MRSMPSNASPPSTASASPTTTATMGASRTASFVKHAKRKDKAHLLRSQRSLPKWDCRASHLRPLGERSKAALARKAALAAGGQHGPLAVRSAPRSAPEQRPPDQQGGPIQARTIQRNQGWIQHEIFAHLWLSCVCTAQCPCFKQLNPTMGCKSTPWAQSRTKSYACMQRASGIKPDNRTCVSSIPLSF